MQRVIKWLDMQQMHHQASNPCSIARGKTDVSCGCDTPRKVSEGKGLGLGLGVGVRVRVIRGR